MSMRALVPGLLVAVACGRGDGPRGGPIHNQTEVPVIAKSTALAIAARWAGPIQLAAEPGRAADADLAALAIRDDVAYDALIARLPAQRVQMKQPAPPSDDPLLARPPIDFATQMLVVVVRPDTLEPPTIARVDGEPDRVVVRFAAPKPGPAAMPSGVGAYGAVLVPRADGPLALVGPRLIEDEAAVDGAVGELVTLRGTMPNTRTPTLLGVDVGDGDGGDGAVEATGWLERDLVTQAEIDARVARSGQYAHRGPGTFYRLVAPEGAGLAPPRRAW